MIAAMKMSVVVPCYNEAENLPLILARFREALTRDDVEVVIVDNGSTDGSPEILKSLLPEYPFARSIRVDVNNGYGHGIMTGLRAARGRFVGWTHADMQTDPGDAVRALEIIESRGGAGIFVKGARTGRSPADTFFTVGMSLFESVYLRAPLWDINAQPNFFERSFLEKWSNPPNDFSLDLYALFMARRHGLDVVRFPVRFPPRAHGESKWNTGIKSRWKFIRRTLDFSVRLKKEI